MPKKFIERNILENLKLSHLLIIGFCFFVLFWPVLCDDVVVATKLDIVDAENYKEQVAKELKVYVIRTSIMEDFCSLFCAYRLYLQIKKLLTWVSL